MTIIQFTINDLERFTEVKAHTIRIWERRYGLIQPNRSKSNYRLYSLEELKRILDIALLNHAGYRISQLAKFPPNVIEHIISKLISELQNQKRVINILTIKMYSLQLDPYAFELFIDKLLQSWPIGILTEKILLPFLKTTGLLCLGHKLYEEHLVVTAIRKKLILAIESVSFIKKNNSKAVLLFLPDAEQLDLGLLYAHYFLKSRGVQVLYLGIDVTIQNIKIILEVQPPAFIFTYFTSNCNVYKTALLKCIQAYSSDTKLIIGNYLSPICDTSYNQNMVHLKFDQALDFLHEQYC